MPDTKKPNTNKKIHFHIDPKTTPVYYTDNMFISSNEYGVIIDFAQNVGTSGDQQVITRVGMSVDHAKKMVQTLHDHLETNER